MPCVISQCLCEVSVVFFRILFLSQRFFCNLCSYAQYQYFVFKYSLCGPKNRLFLRVDNFAMVNGRKICDISNVSEFCLEKEQNLHISVFKYYLPKLHKLSLHVKLPVINSQK